MCKLKKTFYDIQTEDTVRGNIEEPLTQNLYTYTHNNPLKYIDPNGHIPIETIFDIASLLISGKDFISNPSLKTFGALAWDTAAALLPYMPGSYITKGAKVLDKADDITDLYKTVKIADKVDDAADLYKTARVVDKVDDVTDLYSTVKVADRIDDVADTYKVAKTVDKISDASKIGKIDDVLEIKRSKLLKGTGKIDDIIDTKKYEHKVTDVVNNFVKNKPKETHHVYSINNKKLTPKYKEIFDKYDVKMNDGLNLIAEMQHRGRHPIEYHELVGEALNNLDEIADRNNDVFKKGLKIINEYIEKKPAMLTRKYWRP